MPAVSVVIPAYRAEAYIERPVRSLLGQTLADWEAVIVADDDADYAACLRERGIVDARIRHASTGCMGSGAARARNAGLDAAGSRIVATLDSDDALAERALEILVPAAATHGAAYSSIQLLDHVTGERLACRDRALPSGLIGLEQIFTSHIHTYAGVVVDRSRIRARWPGWMKRWEDVYFFASCFDDVGAMYHAEEPLYLYYRREGSICNRTETMAEYLAWADDVARRIASGDEIGLREASVRVTFGRLLRSRYLIESVFRDDLADGRCVDFQDFIGRRQDLFYSLDAPGTCTASIASSTRSWSGEP
ncbi:MAG TPA: glycosyltransferase family 2 protein [Kofleriaceae bacterium]|nr:glycosyltransferase family 2 protein [Kofleriaceae bacterium]